MTDEDLAKRMSELCDAFKEMCMGRDCEGCEMETFAKEGVCAHAWVWKWLRAETCGRMDVCPAAQKEKAAAAAPNESPKAKEGTRLPKWCKVGAWVLMDNKLYKIVDVDSGHYHPLTVKDIHGGYSFAHPNIVYPVRFRPYTYIEAKDLLGKVMEYRSRTECSFVCYSMLISRVSFNPDSGEVFIHSCSFSDWWGYEPTIDGAPIGVPEVDEEAMKEGGRMKHHEQTRITIEMDSCDGNFGEIYIDVACRDKRKPVKVTQEEARFILKSIFERCLKKVKEMEE